jgi:predicted N-acyltransferase
MLGALGLHQRRGIQYHWENDGYETFNDFEMALKQSKRKSIRQVGGLGGEGWGGWVLGASRRLPLKIPTPTNPPTDPQTRPDRPPQERKSVAKQGLRVRRLTGRTGPDALQPHHWERFHEFYLNTVDKRWGSAYLTRKFFEMWVDWFESGD